jgi:sugar O-acyltransferase (sialic acid O-acetyltransferase NeuD family)
MAERLLMIGASGHAHALLGLLRRLGEYAVVGLIDDTKPEGGLVFGLPVLGGLADVPRLCAAHDLEQAVLAVGHNGQRQQLLEQLQRRVPALQWPVLVDPTAVVSQPSRLGAASVVMALAHVGPGASLGPGCLLNTRSSLDHDGCMGAFASLAPGVHCGGHVQLGARAAVGLGASLLQRVSIGSDTVVGAGAVVLASLPGGVVAHGVPARVVRQRQPLESYL